MKRLMISAMSSGSGKTAVTCGLLMALKRTGLPVRAFKCGPDYIDPMFHSRVLGVPSRNLDLFLQGEEGVRRTLLTAQGDRFALIEGAMGFYDGVGGTEQGSAWQTADVTDTPVILVLRPSGASLTLAAQVQGVQSFRKPSHIAGLLINDCKPMLYAHLSPIMERETGLPVLGYLPPMAEAMLESRHLGLLTAVEISDLTARFESIAEQIEKTVDLKRLLNLAADTPDRIVPSVLAAQSGCRIAVAVDEAFCFYYEDNLDALRKAGAELCSFSPLHDRQIPENVDGLYLGGGYPELYAERLSQNESMRQRIKEAAQMGMPIVAECGGFLYLQQGLEDSGGRVWPMAGVLPGRGIKTDRLQRFGYLELTIQENSMLFRQGEIIPAHEFHYWDCTENGKSLQARKPASGKQWECGFVGANLYAAFPHLHFGGAIPLARRFVDAAVKWRETR